jgi:hypothetical protein
MRVPGKAGQILVRVVVPKVIEEQKRIEIRGVSESEGTAEVHTGALYGGLRLADVFDGSDGHGSSSYRYDARSIR